MHDKHFNKPSSTMRLMLADLKQYIQEDWAESPGLNLATDKNQKPT